MGKSDWSKAQGGVAGRRDACCSASSSEEGLPAPSVLWGSGRARPARISAVAYPGLPPILNLPRSDKFSYSVNATLEICLSAHYFFFASQVIVLCSKELF